MWKQYLKLIWDTGVPLAMVGVALFMVASGKWVEGLLWLILASQSITDNRIDTLKAKLDILIDQQSDALNWLKDDRNV